MKTTLKYLFLSAAMLVTISCEKKPIQQEEQKEVSFYSISTPFYARSFVFQYFDVDNMSFILRETDYIHEGIIYIGLFGDGDFNGKGYHLGNVLEENIKHYDKLCEKHNDMTFNKGVSGMRPEGSGPYAGYPSVDFTAISIVSDADWDEDTTAGKSLNDKALFYADTAYPFIKNEYPEENIRWYNAQHTVIDFFRTQLGSVKKMVSELEVEDLILLGDGYTSYFEELQRYFHTLATLKFPNPPTLSQTHNITIKLTADDGRVFEDTIAMSWE